MGRVWYCGVRGNTSLGNKLGIASKFNGHDWQEPTFISRVNTPKDIFDNGQLAAKGFAIPRDELPQESYAFSEKHFRRARAFFWLRGFAAVKGKLAEILLDMDVGEGSELVPHTIYGEDRKTPLKGPFYIFNLNARKRSFRSDLLERKHMITHFDYPEQGVDAYTVCPGPGDFALSVSLAALQGPDIWMEEQVWGGAYFVSERLAEALKKAKLADLMRLRECRIVPEGENNG